MIVFAKAGLHNPSLILGIGWVLGAFIQPLIGMLSDNYIGYGRKPFILAGVSMCIISLLLLFENKLYTIYNIMLFYTGLHIYQIPLSAFIPDQIDKKKLQTISGLWNLSGGLGTIAAPMLGVLLLGKGYNYIYLGLLIVLIISTAVPLLTIKEKQFNKFRHNDMKEKIIDYLANKSIKRFYTAKFFWWLGLGAYLPFIVNNLIEKGFSEVDAGLIYSLFMTINCLSSILLIRLKKIDTYSVLTNAVIGFGLFTLMIYLINDNAIIALLIMMSGMLYGFIIVCSYRIMIGMIPQGEGGMYLGMDNIFLNTPQAIAAFLVSATIDFDNELFLLISSFFMSASFIYILHKWNK